MITTNLMMPVLRFSYLHSHRGQNSCSFVLILLPTRGKITPSQLLKSNGKFRKKLIISRNRRIRPRFFLPFRWWYIFNNQIAIGLQCVVAQHRIETRTYTFASLIFIWLRLRTQKQREIRIKIKSSRTQVNVARRGDQLLLLMCHSTLLDLLHKKEISYLQWKPNTILFFV